MSGRINPREYDLGELRDAVRATSRREGTQPGTNPPVDRGIEFRERTPEFESNGAKFGSELTKPPAHERDGGTSVGEDPEAYVRSRTQRDRLAADNRRRPDDRRRGGNGTEPAGVDGRNRYRSGSESSPKVGEDVDLGRLARDSPIASRPYLEELPGTYGAQLEIFEWLDRMLSKAGREGTISALAYYESVEWLSAESRAELEAFVSGLETTGAADGSLGIVDHRKSLAYVVRLAGRLRR